MKSLSEQIWEVPVYLPYLQPALTEEASARAEIQLGVKLPQSYLNLLAHQNGGYVRFRLPDSVHSEIWGIGPNFPSITKDHPWRNSDFDAEDTWLPNSPKLLIPFDGDGHWYLCFDFRTHGADGEPSVTYLDLECGHEDPIAPSFSSFLEILKPDYGQDRFGIIDDLPIEHAVTMLQSVLGKPFKDMGSSNHGYPQYRFDLASGDKKQWAWLSPNKVRRGFVRTSDRRYVELKDALPGMALRFPEFPNINLVVAATETVADTVRIACEQAGLTVARFDSDYSK